MADLFVKLETSFLMNGKVLSCDLVAQAIYLRSLLLAKQALTDGLITPSQLSIIAPNMGAYGDPNGGAYGGPEGPIEQLVDSGLWHKPGHGCADCPAIDSGWVIHGFLTMNPSSAEVSDRKNEGRRNALVGWHNRGNHQSDPHPDCPLCGDPNGGAYGDPIGGRNGGPLPETETETETETTTSEPSSDEQFSEEVHQLTRRLALAVRANGFTIPKEGQKARNSWLTEMDRLLRLGPPGGDGDPELVPDVEEVKKVIDWATADPFWKANIQSAPKFREQYPKLRIRALEDVGPSVVDEPDRMVG